MSNLVEAAKHCLSCHKAYFGFTKGLHTNKFFRALGFAINASEMQFEDGHLTEDELFEHQDLITEITVVCLDCDKKSANAFQFINERVVSFIRQDIKEAQTERTAARQAAMRRKGVEQEGNVYKANFTKK